VTKPQTIQIQTQNEEIFRRRINLLWVTRCRACHPGSGGNQNSRTESHALSTCLLNFSAQEIRAMMLSKVFLHRLSVDSIHHNLIEKAKGAYPTEVPSTLLPFRISNAALSRSSHVTQIDRESIQLCQIHCFFLGVHPSQPQSIANRREGCTKPDAVGAGAAMKCIAANRRQGGLRFECHRSE
jgi:hypothetical protein